jgi:Tfp pilus assembly protein PilX
MIVKRHPRMSPGDEKGMVLVLGLLLVAVLSLVGTTAVMTSTTDMKINSNYKSGAQAFYIAEAGIERARAQLMTLGSTTLPRPSLRGGARTINFRTAQILPISLPTAPL